MVLEQKSNSRHCEGYCSVRDTVLVFIDTVIYFMTKQCSLRQILR